MERRVFGPVPSRRLGKSLRVNNIPHKICSYSCLYCQVGKAFKMQVNRQEFYKPQVLVDEVKAVLCNIQNNDEYPDYITIVPNGEPTLDIHLGELIDRLKAIKIPVAVITNASLIQYPDVQNDLLKADYVSVKADTFNIENWHKINKPHKDLTLNEVACGISSFARKFSGKLVTESMLLKGINDTYDDLDYTARFIETFEPHTAYISIPTRPPAFKEAIPADETTVNEAYHIFKEHIDKVELITGYEGNRFSASGNSESDLLSITAVHPMREDAVYDLLQKNGDDEKILLKLLNENRMEKIIYNDANFYLRKFKRL